MSDELDEDSDTEDLLDGVESDWIATELRGRFALLDASIKKLSGELADRERQLAEAYREGEEQARLLGRGSEREARLLGRVTELERQLARITDAKECAGFLIEDAVTTVLKRSAVLECANKNTERSRVRAEAAEAKLRAVGAWCEGVETYEAKNLTRDGEVWLATRGQSAKEIRAILGGTA